MEITFSFIEFLPNPPQLVGIDYRTDEGLIIPDFELDKDIAFIEGMDCDYFQALTRPMIGSNDNQQDVFDYFETYNGEPLMYQYAGEAWGLLITDDDSTSFYKMHDLNGDRVFDSADELIQVADFYDILDPMALSHDFVFA